MNKYDGKNYSQWLFHEKYVLKMKNMFSEATRTKLKFDVTANVRKWEKDMITISASMRMK